MPSSSRSRSESDAATHRELNESLTRVIIGLQAENESLKARLHGGSLDAPLEPRSSSPQEPTHLY